MLAARLEGTPEGSLMGCNRDCKHKGCKYASRHHVISLAEKQPRLPLHACLLCCLVAGLRLLLCQVRNFKAGLELFSRIGEVAEAEGHHPDLHLVGYNQVFAELSTHSVGEPVPSPLILSL